MLVGSDLATELQRGINVGTTTFSIGRGMIWHGGKGGVRYRIDGIDVSENDFELQLAKRLHAGDVARACRTTINGQPHRLCHSGDAYLLDGVKISKEDFERYLSSSPSIDMSGMGTPLE